MMKFNLLKVASMVVASIEVATIHGKFATEESERFTSLPTVEVEAYDFCLYTDLKICHKHLEQ